MRDLNIDLLKYENCTYSQALLHCTQSFSMLPVLDKPTRVHGTSATLIDNTCRCSDVNKSFSRFYKNINRLINKHAPLKDVSKRRLKLLTKPWLTKGIRRSIRVKNNLFFLDPSLPRTSNCGLRLPVCGSTFKQNSI